MKYLKALGFTFLLGLPGLFILSVMALDFIKNHMADMLWIPIGALVCGLGIAYVAVLEYMQ
jgi:hypothetical protein